MAKLLDHFFQYQVSERQLETQREIACVCVCVCAHVYAFVSVRAHDTCICLKEEVFEHRCLNVCEI